MTPSDELFKEVVEALRDARDGFDEADHLPCRCGEGEEGERNCPRCDALMKLDHKIEVVLDKVDRHSDEEM